jgi:nitrogen regulatory protein PII
MKLLIITAIAAFEENIKQMLKQAEVKTFTYKEVKGHKDISEESIESNWFGSEMNENESILFYAFVKNENVNRLFELVDDCNEKQETMSKIHVAVLNIERSNNPTI